jgi:hypothetical protein
MEQTSRPKIQLLIAALVLTVAISFVPFGNLIVAPFTLFVTFVHEIFHLIAGLVTGGSVKSLTVSADGSGMVLYQTDSALSSAITSSAGYMGTVFFGALLMIFLRKGKSGNRLLSITGWILLFSTMLFGFLIPMVNIFWLPISFLSILFTTATGVAIGGALILSGRFFSKPVAEFALAFLAIQCILNGFNDIMFLMELHAPTMHLAGGIDPSAIGDVASGVGDAASGVGDAEIGSSAGEVGVPHSDALNMQNITGIPAMAWSIKWMAISIILVVFALLSYRKRNA